MNYVSDIFTNILRQNFPPPTPQRPKFLCFLNPTLHQTCLHPLRHIRRNRSPELLQVLPRKRLSPNRRPDDIVLEAKEALRRLQDTRVLTRETRHKDGWCAVRVELRVQRPLREERHLVLAQVIDDRLGAVLANELGNQTAGDDDVDLGRARVRVRCVEATGGEEAEGHAEGGAD